jgi:hypothetical protein
MLRNRSTECRLTGIVEKRLVERHVSCRDDRRLGRNPNAKNVSGVVANEVANEGTLKELLLS